MTIEVLNSLKKTIGEISEIPDLPSSIRISEVIKIVTLTRDFNSKILTDEEKTTLATYASHVLLTRDLKNTNNKPILDCKPDIFS